MAPPVVRSQTQQWRGSSSNGKKLFPGKEAQNVGNAKSNKNIRPLGVRNGRQCTTSMKPNTTSKDVSGVKMIDNIKTPVDVSSPKNAGGGGAACLPVFNSPSSDVFQDNNSESVECYSPSPPPPPPPPPTFSSSAAEFCPPLEVVSILHDLAPLSPIRNPSFEVNPRVRRNTTPDLFLRHDMDQMKMKSCLYDAMRLVKVILGSDAPNLDKKPTDGNGSFSFSNGSILRAIRSYALMRQELQQLRQKAGLEDYCQKRDDNDDDDGDDEASNLPIILPSLSNSTSGAAPSRGRSFSIASDAAAGAGGTLEGSPTRSIGLRSVPANHSRPHYRNKIIEAAKKIQTLDKELQEAKARIKELEEASRSNQVVETEVVKANDLERMEMQTKFEESERKYQEMTSKYDQLVEKHNQTIEEYKNHAEDIAMNLQSIPRSQVEPKKAQEIKAKLQNLVQLVAKHSSHGEIDKLQNQLNLQEKKYQEDIEVLKTQVTMLQQEKLVRISNEPTEGRMDPKVIEDILLKLNAVPTSSVPEQERTKVCDYVRSMLQELAEAQTKDKVVELMEKVRQIEKKDEEKADSLEKMRIQLQDIESAGKVKVQELQQQFEKEKSSFQSELSAFRQREQKLSDQLRKLKEESASEEKKEGDIPVDVLRMKLQEAETRLERLQSQQDAEKTKFARIECIVRKHDEMEEARAKVQCGIEHAIAVLNSSEARAKELQTERDSVIAEASSLKMQLTESRVYIDELVARLGQAGLDAELAAVSHEMEDTCIPDETKVAEKEYTGHTSSLALLRNSLEQIKCSDYAKYSSSGKFPNDIVSQLESANEEYQALWSELTHIRDSTDDTRKGKSGSLCHRLQSLYVEHEALMSTVKDLEKEEGTDLEENGYTEYEV